MHNFKVRDEMFRQRQKARLYLTRNFVDRDRLNLGAFRDFCDLDVSIPLYAEIERVHKQKLNEELISRFHSGVRLIFIDFRLTSLLNLFLGVIYKRFDGTFIIDTADLSVQVQPNWVGPSASWAAAHIPDPEESTGTLLPLGVEDARWSKNNLPWLFPNRLRKVPKILVGPFGPTHQSRRELSMLHSINNVVVLRKRLSPARYSHQSSKYKFVFCPRGNGIDTHRVWETIYRGSIPILMKDEWSEYLAKLGFPFFIIENTSDLYDLTIHELERAYDTLQQKLITNAHLLTNEFWLQKLSKPTNKSFKSL